MITDQVVTASDGRKNLYELIERVQNYGQKITLTHHGKAAAVLINPEELESYLETVAIQSDPKAMKKIKMGEKEIREEKTVSLDELE